MKIEAGKARREFSNFHRIGPPSDAQLRFVLFHKRDMRNTGMSGLLTLPLRAFAQTNAWASAILLDELDPRSLESPPHS